MHDHFNTGLNVEELIRQVGPQLVVELGAGSGLNTRQLAPLCRELGARLIVISDGKKPEVPELAWVDWRWQISYLALKSFTEGSIDVASVDTDHNSWTVDQELGVLAEKVREGGLVVLHDTVSFALNNGYMTGYGSGDSYRIGEMLKDGRTYTEVVRSWVGRGYEVVRETEESNGAVALRRVLL